MASLSSLLKRPWSAERASSEDVSIKSTEQEKESAEVSVLATTSVTDEYEDDGTLSKASSMHATLLTAR